MINGVVFLASYGFGGGTIGNLLAQWEAAGIFAYALPFLLIFALVFAILGFIPLFKDNRGINAVISLVTALMALQFNMVPLFFSEIFPRLGIGLSVVLVFIILLGLLVQDDKKGNQIIKWMFALVAIITAIVVVSKAFGSFGYGWGNGQFWYFLETRWPAVLGIGILVAGVIAIIATGAKKPKAPEIDIGPLFRK
jgi:hypothetical protein